MRSHTTAFDKTGKWSQIKELVFSLFFQKCQSQGLKCPFTDFLLNANYSSLTWLMLIPVLLVSQIQEHRSSHQTHCSAVVCNILLLRLASVSHLSKAGIRTSLQALWDNCHPLRSHPCFCCKLTFILKHKVPHSSINNPVWVILPYLYTCIYNHCCFLASNKIWFLSMGHWYQNISENKCLNLCVQWRKELLRVF